MNNKIVVTFLLVVLSIFGFAQQSINNYKYIIIPKSYEFSKSDDQYQLNSLTKFLFNKYGYEAYFINEMPEDLKNDRCLGLKAEVSNDPSSMFRTRLEIILKDCYDNVITTSQIGESRFKEFDKAYNIALRNAFKTFQNLDYQYVPTNDHSDKLTEEKQSKSDIVDIEEVVEEMPVIKNKEKKVIAVADKKSTSLKNELFYAQEISNGYQLVNSEPKVVMVLLQTSAQNIFIVKGKSAIVYKEDGFWYYSENDGVLGEQISMNIKF